MSNKQGYISPLARRHRSAVFYSMLTLFVLSVPVFAFYANGYRLDLLSEQRTVTVTGGMYIASYADSTDIYVNDRPVRNTRFFRRATYIQGLAPGRTRVHVQGEGLHTWVKELPVFEQIVTEATAFTMPVVPQIRPITPYRTAAGMPLFVGYASTSSLPFQFASTTIPVAFSTSTATTTALENPEYEFLTTRLAQLHRPDLQAAPQERFRFVSPEDGPGLVGTTTVATSTVQRSGIELSFRNSEVYARYVGPIRAIPYYWCVPDMTAASTTEFYGEHVTRSLQQLLPIASSTIVARGSWFEQVCRTEIRLDRKQQPVIWFDFFPGSSDLVLLQLADGLYVTEIDDRSWHNHQLLYPGSDIEFIVEGASIIVRDGDYFVEVFTEIAD